ncbi:MAG: histidine kinase [Lamprobacter sp.]|uniref:histidine kinase n=1 Tax=Lamprobacter sp. TaxID=3100796 RepID=UPI002B259726|nr:histidine kinase [Lamprobacter sp.]MEA3640252.1 histidine kinase [Lamprobacter sp.]
MDEDAALDVWFDRGWDVYKGARQDGDYPPLNDMEAQRWWLGGFGAAWEAAPFEMPQDRLVNGDLLNLGDVDKALNEALQGRVDLLHQLRAHGSLTTSSQRLH